MAPSAFLASAAATLPLQLLISKPSAADPDIDRALAIWSSLTNHPAPMPPSLTGRQGSWDDLVVEASLSSLSSQMQDPFSMARLKAALDPHSGDWLKAVPITAVGLRLDDDAIRIAVGLRLGTPLCSPHPCSCGDLVDARGTHGLSCRRSKGRLPKHAQLNDIIHRSLSSAGFPAIKEPTGLLRSDNKRPDGCTLTPWQSGKCLAWDVTACDTLARSYLLDTSQSAGAAAESAATRKIAKYTDVARTHLFIPIAVESLGPINGAGVNFLTTLGRRLSEKTGDPRETHYLFQRLSIVNQRLNAAAITGCFPACEASGDD